MKRRIEPQPPENCEEILVCPGGLWKGFAPGYWKQTPLNLGCTDYLSAPPDMSNAKPKLIDGTWYWIDDQPEPDSDKCPSCGVPYTEHLGLIGTCKRVKELTADRDRLHVLLSCAHGALADCGLPVPGMDQDIAPVIRQLTEDRDRYKRLVGELAQSLYSAAMTSHYRGIGEFCHNDFDHCTNSGCVGFHLLINKARQEGVIE